VQHAGGIVARRGIGKGQRKAGKRAGIDLGDDIIEVGEVMVERARRIADGAAERAGGTYRYRPSRSDPRRYR